LLTIPSISTSQTISSEQKTKPQHMTFVNPDPCLGQRQKCGGVKYAFVVQYLCCL